MTVGRRMKRTFKKARGKVIKRYFNKGYVPKLSTLASDVGLVKRMLNAEKKMLQSTISAQAVGQISTNATGAYFKDITPIIGQGSQSNQRTGDSVKLSGLFCKFVFIEQGNFNGMGNYKIEIFKVIGQPQTTGTISSQYYQSDPISGVIDYNSQRDADFYAQYKKVYTKNIRINSNYGSDIMNKSITIKLRLNHHVRYVTQTNTVADGQYMMVITGDNGNCANTISTLNAATIPNTTGYSGFWVNANMNWYYYDN